MRKWESARLAQITDEKSFHVFHGLEDLDYHNTMVNWALTARCPGFGKVPRSGMLRIIGPGAFV